MEKQVRQVRNETYQQVAPHVGSQAGIQMAIAVMKDTVKEKEPK